MTHKDMSFLVGLLGAIAFFLLVISIQIGSIAARLKERFPTSEEEDYQWAQDDPMGHYEAHKKDQISK
ncbi:MAG: hypothetical protein ABSA54_06740 [Terriglobales bacterium]|jgi:hypothetical protein